MITCTTFFVMFLLSFPFFLSFLKVFFFFFLLNSPVGIWKKEDNEPVSHPFVDEPGIQVQLLEYYHPIDFVRLYFTEEFWDLLTTEKNRYASCRQHIATKSDTSPPRALIGQEPDTSYCFGDEDLHVLVLDDWHCVETSLGPVLDSRQRITPSFSAAMKHDRWMSILMCLHFAENEAADVNDKLRQVRPLLNLLLNRFQEMYTPSQTISMDDELIAWKGRLNCRQYIPSKRARFGIKIFAVYMCVKTPATCTISLCMPARITQPSRQPR